MWHPRLASTHYHIYLIPKWVHSKLVVPWAWKCLNVSYTAVSSCWRGMERPEEAMA